MKPSFACTLIKKAISQLEGSSKLKPTAEFLLGIKNLPTHDEARKKGPKDFLVYAANDPLLTNRIDKILSQNIENANTQALYAIELQFAIDCIECGDNGLLFDLEKLNLLKIELEAQLRAVHAQLRSHLGRAINLNSPKQLFEIIAVDLGLPIPQSKGKPSSKIEDLKKLRRRLVEVQQ